MAKKRELSVTISNPDAIKVIHYTRSDKNDFVFTIITGAIKKVTILEDSVLVFQFETAELRIDIEINDLIKLKQTDEIL